MSHTEFAFRCLKLTKLAKYEFHSRSIVQMLDGDLPLQDYLANNDVWNGNVCPTWITEFPPLHKAAWYRRTATIKTLVEEYNLNVDSRWIGAYSHYHSQSSTTPLFCAIYSSGVAAVNTLLECGADASLGGTIHGTHYNNALAYAKSKDNAQIIQLLEEKTKGW